MARDFGVVSLVLRGAVRAVKVLMLPVRRVLPGRRPPVIVAYRGYGTARRMRLLGRVVEDTGIEEEGRSGSTWRRMATLYRRVAARAVEDALVRVRLGDLELEVRTDSDGFFSAWIEPEEPVAADGGWSRAELELVSPDPAEPVRASAEIMVSPDGARRVVISDIDDTVVETGVASWARMFWRLYTSPAESRVAFPGAPALYRALRGDEQNPLLWVSRGPWVTYGMLEAFFHLHRIPAGPVLLLRDWGLSPSHPLPRRQEDHKRALIDEILSVYRDLPVVLVGDSGQRDPEIYAETVRRHPDRVRAIYIRDAGRGAHRAEAIDVLAKEVREAGCALVLARDTRAMARHVAGQGWIPPEALEEIEAASEAMDRVRRAPGSPAVVVDPEE